MAERMVGNPAKLQDGSPISMKVIDLMSRSESYGGAWPLE